MRKGGGSIPSGRTNYMFNSIKDWFCGTEYTIGKPHQLYRRFILFPYQRVTRGFDDSVTWDLQVTIATFALPRLRLYKERLQGHPAHLEEAEWYEILDKMIWSLEYVTLDHDEIEKLLPSEVWLTDRDYDLMTTNWYVLSEDGTTNKFKELNPPENKEERAAFKEKWNAHMEAERVLDDRCAEGLALFGKYFRALWG